jgi:phage tail-like protein
MEAKEFKVQLFKTPKQWKSGLFYRLNMIEKSEKEVEISLYSTPYFEQWLKIDDKEEMNGFSAVVVGECGLLYYIFEGKLYRYDPKIEREEQIEAVSGCDKLLLDKFTFWAIDSENGKVKAFSREIFQIKYIIDDLNNPIDMIIDKEGKLYILDADEDSKKIVVYENNGQPTGLSFTDEYITSPRGLAVDKDNILYVIDSSVSGFIKFKTDGKCLGKVGDFKTYQPTMITIDKDQNIFTSDGSIVKQFDADGSFIAEIEIPNINSIAAITVDHSGNLYASTDQGIALLTMQGKVTKEQGFYYSKTLDGSKKECQWHRFAIGSKLPEKTLFEVYYHASDDDQLKEKYEKVLADDNKSVQEKKQKLDKLIPWESDAKNSPGDMLFQNAKGRYLWVKIALSTYDETVSPKITQAKILYPRISYLRYLPSIYQEDPVSKAFLERFLSLFESVFYDLEIDIANVYKYFDPETTPKEFLEWLGSWLNRALEEDWDEKTKRDFIKDAYSLYKLKGTPEGIKKAIEIYTGEKPVIVEYQNMIKPMILTEKGRFRLGVNTLLFQTPVRGFTVGSDSILGRTALIESTSSSENPFSTLAHRFSVVVNLPSKEAKKYEKGIKKIIDEEKPAHTICTLRFTGDTNSFGMWSYVEVNSVVDDYHAMQLGENAILGRNLIAMDLGEKGGKVERHGRIGLSDDFLI